MEGAVCGCKPLQPSAVEALQYAAALPGFHQLPSYVFPALAPYLSSLSQAQGYPRPQDAGIWVHPGWPSAGRLSSTARRWDEEEEEIGILTYSLFPVHPSPPYWVFPYILSSI